MIFQTESVVFWMALQRKVAQTASSSQEIIPINLVKRLLKNYFPEEVGQIASFAAVPEWPMALWIPPDFNFTFLSLINFPLPRMTISLLLIRTPIN